MGQRLCATIKKGERKLCNIYFHWDAYTYNALIDTKKIINCIYNNKDETEEEMLLRLIHFCEENGGGIRGGFGSDEWVHIRNLYPNEVFKAENINRSNGLIALSESGMIELQQWSEGDVFINLDTDQVDFCVYCGYESLEEYIEERKSWDEDFDEKELENIPEFDFCLGYFDANDIDAIANEIYNTDSHVIKCDGEICEMIE